jgi:hypothetical protein
MTVVRSALVPAYDNDAIGGSVIVHGLPSTQIVDPVVRTALRLRARRNAARRTGGRAD